MKWKSSYFFLILCSGCLLSLASAVAIDIGTSVTANPATLTVSQGDYRWYGNVDALTSITPLASEDTATGTPAQGSISRLRMNVRDASLQLDSGATFTLQFANAISGPWTDVSTSTAWIFFDNPSVADGQIIVSTVLGTSDTGESYGESNPSAASPNAILPGQRGEWDWVLQNNSASTASSWFFRMIFSSSTAFNAYDDFPALNAVPPPSPPPPPSTPPSVIGVAGGYSPPPFSAPSPTSSVAQSSTPGMEETSMSEEATTSLPVPPPILPPAFQAIDLNGDNRIDIVDLSILIYHYGERGSSRYDLNKDGVIDLTDISILMYYWVE